MMKNEKGITLIALVITIIVTLILVGTGISITFNEIDDARNNQLWTELGTVRQAVIEQYQKALAVGKTGKLKEEAKLDVWIGAQITTRRGTDFFPGAVNAILEQQGITSGAYMFSYDYNNCQYQEDCCYELDSNSLAQLGIEDAKHTKHTYIVNYKTGEVYNETKQTDYNGKLLYLIPVNYSNQTPVTDTESFNDWSGEFGD